MKSQHKTYSWLPCESDIFYVNYMKFFDYIKDDRVGFSQVTTGHQSDMLEFVRTQGCHEWLELEQG